MYNALTEKIWQSTQSTHQFILVYVWNKPSATAVSAAPSTSSSAITGTFSWQMTSLSTLVTSLLAGTSSISLWRSAAVATTTTTTSSPLPRLRANLTSGVFYSNPWTADISIKVARNLKPFTFWQTENFSSCNNYFLSVITNLYNASSSKSV